MSTLAAPRQPADQLRPHRHPFGRASLDAPGLTVLLARDGDAKARIFRSLQHELSAAAGAPANGSPAAEALWIRTHVATGSADRDQAELAEQLDAGSMERPARAALAALRARAAILLAADGSGHIGQLLARLRALDDRLAAAAEAEQAARARCEARLAAAVGFADLVRERDGAAAERAHWRALIRLWPDWQRLQQIRRELAAAARFERVPPDIERRHAELEERWAMVQRAGREAGRRASELRAERDGLLAAVDQLAPGSAESAVRLCAELPVYRSRLLQLAAARARLAELERTLATRVDRLGRAWDIPRVAETVLATAHGDELQRWQQASRRTQTAHAAAERAQTAARERVRDLCGQVSEHLAREPIDGDDDGDARWRVLWKLRADLEEIWDVQSRAESTARTLADREDALRRLGAASHWTPPRWLLAILTGLAVLAIATLAAGALPGAMMTAALGALALALGAARMAGHARVRWVGVLEQRGAADGERLQREIGSLRRQRDAAWTRAAQLTASIRDAGTRLALPDPVTPEAVEACEQELAAQLRAGGASTQLTALLLDLLASQDDEQRATAELDDAAAQRQALTREWEAWRAAAGFPHDIEIERIDERLAELQQLTDVRAARDAARSELLSLEPLTAAWEAEARGVLQQAGAQGQPELCGSALAAELSALAARGRADAERRARRARIAAELPEAERQVAAAEADLARAGADRQELLDVTGAADDAALQALLDGVRQWRALTERARRLQAAIDQRLDRLVSPGDARAELATGERKRWYTELQQSNARLTDLAACVNEAVPRQRAAEECLDAARAASEVAGLRLEREEILAELSAAAREWKMHVLAAALIETSLLEQRRAGMSELLQAASRTLATLTRGQYTGIARSEQAAGLMLVDRNGGRVPVSHTLGATLLGQVQLSMLLGRAAQLTSRGASRPFVVDDVLGPLALDDAQLVARELAVIARAHPVLYLTTAAQGARALSALPAGTTVVEVE